MKKENYCLIKHAAIALLNTCFRNNYNKESSTGSSTLAVIEFEGNEET